MLRARSSFWLGFAERKLRRRNPISVSARNAQSLASTEERDSCARAKCASMKTEVMPARADSNLFNLKKILVPSDFSPASSKAFKYALRFAKQFGAKLTLLHVLEPVPPSLIGITPAPGSSKKELATAEKNLRAWAASARAAGVAEAKSTIRTGLASHEILEAARELDADLIVIATHGFTGWKHFCIGSTAERVARSAPCPVLVVREKEHEFI